MMRMHQELTPERAVRAKRAATARGAASPEAAGERASSAPAGRDGEREAASSALAVSLMVAAKEGAASRWRRPVARRASRPRLPALPLAGQVQRCRALVQTGADVNAVDFDDVSALHVAARQGDVELSRELLNLGANSAARDRWGRTPLGYAEAAANRAPDSTASELSRWLTRGGPSGATGGGYNRGAREDAPVADGAAAGELARLLRAHGEAQAMKQSRH